MFRLALCVALATCASVHADLVRTDLERCRLESRDCELAREAAGNQRLIAAFSIKPAAIDTAHEMEWEAPTAATFGTPQFVMDTRPLPQHVAIDGRTALEAAASTQLASPTEIQFPTTLGRPKARFSRTRGRLN